MATKYFKTNLAIDERILGIIEDSIYCNPSLTQEDKDALVKQLYSSFFESKDGQKWTLHKLEKPYTIPQK